MEVQVLNYHISGELDTPINHWVMRFIIESIGLKANAVQEPSDAVQWVYGTVELSGAIVTTPNEKDVLNEALLSGDKEWQADFDYVHAIKSFLLDTVNESKSGADYDVHGRLNSLNAFASDHGYQLTPIVNVYLASIEAKLVETFGVQPLPRFPEGKKAVVVLSHDVDDPRKYSILDSYKLFPSGLGLKNFALYHMEATKKRLQRSKEKDETIYWVFEEVMNAESKHGFSSTFFFAVTNRFEKHANYGFDVPYDIKDDRFQEVFQQMQERDFEIGLHASYDARKKSGRIQEEKNKLEEVSGVKMVGNRHHFWQIGPNPIETLKEHTRAGLQYDSSLAFNDAPGYRRSVAVPYFPFDVEGNRPSEVLQVPTFMMDSNFLKNPVFGPDQALGQAQKCIDKLLENNGVAAIDWHVRTSFPSSERFKEWGETYLGILDYLASKEEIWVTNFKTYFKWYEERQKKLS